MSEDAGEQPSPISDLADKGNEVLEQTQDKAADALSSVAEYVRANPWVALAGAAIVGGVIVALSRPKQPEHPNLDSLREWLDEAVAKLPSKKQIRKAAQSPAINDFLSDLKKKLGLN